MSYSDDEGSKDEDKVTHCGLEKDIVLNKMDRDILKILGL
jgi:hypothetical protein